MKSDTVVFKFPQSSNEPLRFYVTGSTQSDYINLNGLSKSYRAEASGLHAIIYYQLIDTIKGFSVLRKNWDSNNADPISKNAILTAIDTLNYLNRRELLSNGIAINIFPMRDGGIQFEFDSDELCGELEINNKSELTFFLFDEEGSIIKEQKLYELSELLTILEDVVYA